MERKGPYQAGACGPCEGLKYSWVCKPVRVAEALQPCALREYYRKALDILHHRKELWGMFAELQP